MKRLNLQNTPTSDQVLVEAVEIKSSDATLRGDLYRPAGAEGALPAVVVTGAWTTVKEQMAGTYARELAERGYITLAFDFSGWGCSDGEPRFVEDPQRKTADILAARAWLVGQDGVDPNQVHGLGVCASSGYIAEVAAQGGFASLALVAPWLHTPKLAEQVYGGPDMVRRLIEASEQENAPVLTAASTDDETAPMFNAPYYTEADRGLIGAYDNKFNPRTWKPWLTYDGIASAPRLEAPLLMVGSDAMALPMGAQTYVEQMRKAPRKLWLEGADQFDFYDREDVVRQAADAVAAHFKTR